MCKEKINDKSESVHSKGGLPLVPLRKAGRGKWERIVQKHLGSLSGRQKGERTEVEVDGHDGEAILDYQRHS